jgi:hypothetical protein
MTWRAAIPLAAFAAWGCTWGQSSGAALTGVSPGRVVAGRTVVLTVEGAGLDPEVVTDFDDPSGSRACVPFRLELRSASHGTFPLVDLSWISSGELRARLDAGAARGTWDVALVYGDGRAVLLPGGVDVTPCSTSCVDGNRCTSNDFCNTGSGFCESGPARDNATACALNCVAGGQAAGTCQSGSCVVTAGACPAPTFSCSP